MSDRAIARALGVADKTVAGPKGAGEAEAFAKGMPSRAGSS